MYKHVLRVALAALLIAGSLAAADTEAQASDSSKPNPLARWFDVDAATWSVRYQGFENSDGTATVNHMQHQPEFRARFKFDREAKVSINAWALSGPYYTGGWNNTGVGTGEWGGRPFLRGLHLSVRPTSGVEFQAGGIEMLVGQGSDVATYAYPSFATGYRMILEKPRQLFFDQIAVTYAHVGEDLTSEIDVYDRFHRMDEINYHQFMVQKNIGDRATVSAGYAFRWGRETLQQAIKINVEELGFIDSIQFENYQRVDVDRDYGFNVNASKNVTDKWTVTGGFAEVDPNYGLINTDAFWGGRRAYMNTTYKLHRYFKIYFLAHHSVNTSHAIPIRRGVQLAFTHDLLEMFRAR